MVRGRGHVLEVGDANKPGKKDFVIITLPAIPSDTVHFHHVLANISFSHLISQLERET